MRSSTAIVAAAIAGGGLACGGMRPALPGARALGSGAVLELAGQFSFPPLTLFPPVIGLRFGGLSGIVSTGAPNEFFAISDDRVGHRVYRIRVTGEGSDFRVELLDTIALEAGAGAPRLDPEAIAVTGGGDLLIASEGRRTQERRIPPVIAQYQRSGSFVRQFPVREKFMPNDSGEPTRGVRGNAGFESLTLSPGGRHLFTATETALVQDGDPVSFDRGTMARVLEYIADGETFVPRREFVYPLDAMGTAPFTPGTNVAGLVELVALSNDELLALERTYIEVAGQRRGINHVRIYHVSLIGAADVSGIDSLRDTGSVAPVRKTLLVDLSTLKGLSPDLNTLDNFEGLAFGPKLADGGSSLLLVSDDNFNSVQRTWFLQLRIATSATKVALVRAGRRH